MGLLAPLYALAALAVVGPIIFHLIRRQPQGQMQFSSLMFLSPSPPRLTRRSRLDNILLLILRALAITLIALAFARPYLRQESILNTALSGRTVVLLLDTSGSMQRSEVWEQAIREGGELLDSLSPADHIAFYTLDESPIAIQSVGDLTNMDATTSQQAVRLALKTIKPSWNSTRLATGLRTIADTLTAATIAGQIESDVDSEVVLISDLHRDSGLESLQGFDWPENIRLDVRQVLPSLPGNARPSLMRAEDEQQAEDAVTRVRIENSAASISNVFSLTWSNAAGESLATTTVQVPAGQVRVIPVGARPGSADRIRLGGDAWDGDNEVFVIEADPVTEHIAFLGETELEDEERLDYFLNRAPLGTPTVQRQIIPATLPELAGILTQPLTKAIILEPIEGIEAHVAALRAFATAGGTVMICLARANQDHQPASSFLAELLEIPDLSIAEAKARDFALISSINYKHPIFVPFADPRFNDFSKIRFWSHRRVELPADLNDKRLAVVANFDDGAPLLVQQSVGEGNIWLLSAGWQPVSSSLGLSSKFIPILHGILDPFGRGRSQSTAYDVGQEIAVEDATDVRVIDADGEVLDATLVSVAGNSLRIAQPGLFRIESGITVQRVAVQVPLSESRVQPLDPDSFEQYGIGMGKVASDNTRRELARQMKIEELESKQRLWQWLIVAGIAVLALETLIAGSLARRNARQFATQ